MSSAQSTPLRLGPGVVGEVELVSATDLKKRLASVLDGVAHHQPVVISRHDQPTAVLISLEDYTQLVEQIPDPIEALRQQFASLLQRASAPGAEAASDQVYAGTPDELAAAAGIITRV